MNERIWSVSNLLSVFRIILVLPIALFILSDEPELRYYAIGLIVFATITDLFDGMLARRLNQVSELGKILDPLADKIAVVVVGIILAKQGKMPMWYLITAVSRDMIIFLGGLYMKRTKGILLQSNQLGKLAVTAVAMFIMLTILDIAILSDLKNGIMIISFALLIVSFLSYVQRFVRLVSSTVHD